MNALLDFALSFVNKKQAEIFALNGIIKLLNIAKGRIEKYVISTTSTIDDDIPVLLDATIQAVTKLRDTLKNQT